MNGLTVYGHSWVAGDRATHASRRFADEVARRLELPLSNRGVGGTSSTDIVELLHRDPPPPSRLYLLMTGLNDARLHGAGRDAVDSYAAALEAIFQAFDDARPTGLTVAVEQPHLIDYSRFAPHNRGSGVAIDAYNLRLRAVARKFPNVLLATVAGWIPATMVSSDTVHPNDAGHAELAHSVIQAVAARYTR